MRKVFTFNLTIKEDLNVIAVPFGAKILSIGVERNEPKLYVLAQEDGGGMKEGNIALIQVVKGDMLIDEHELYEMQYLRTLSFDGVPYHFFHCNRI